MSEVLSAVPAVLTRGDLIYVRKVLTTYPAPTYTLTLGASSTDGTQHHAWTAAAQADESHLLTLAPAAVGVDLSPGDFRYLLRITDGATISTTVERGVFSVHADLTEGAVDERHPLEVALANVQALMSGATSKNVQSYSIAGRSLSSYTPSELVELHKHLQTEVAKVRARRAAQLGQTTPRVVRARL